MDRGASEQPLLGACEAHRRRRPVTIHRTGRRGKLHALAADSQTLAGSSSDFSTRHTAVREETGGNPIDILNRLLNTLKESGIPGPQLFRLENEFSTQLGQGGQGNVRGLDANAAQQYRQANPGLRKRWPVEHIAIKQHLERKDGNAHKARFGRENLSSRFRAAECEVLALALGLFHGHPNIVELVGWGLCLDTIENPTSPCCGGLQLPLLVFERADMNLAQFLEDLLPEPGRSRTVEARLEEGRPISTRDAESPSLPRRLWKHVWRWQSGVKHDVDYYELVRLLCIDVGRALQSLHENNFTHGDLKPENVLVFKTASGYTAKLCDFGCAVGHDQSGLGAGDDGQDDTNEDNIQKQKRRKTTYFGTPGWIPPTNELEAIQGFDELRRCDLYVYGLLVWSCFCLGGKPYVRRPRLQDMLQDLTELTTSGFGNEHGFRAPRRWIIPQLRLLLKDTMKDAAERGPKPWELLYHPKRGQNESSNADQIRRLAPNLRIQDPDEMEIHLSSEIKAGYNERSWWPHNRQQGHSTTPVNTNFQPDPVSKMASEPDRSDSHVLGPASSAVLGSDDNCLSTAIFHTRKRREDTKDLASRMESAVLELGSSLGAHDRMLSREKLYCLARFRRRVPSEWWGESFMRNQNILNMALQSNVPVDKHTLAWLCAGPVGRAEAKSLIGEPDTWRSIVEWNILNESEKLDRFLLLLQSGAPVEKSPYLPFLPDRWQETPHDPVNTIFARYLESCRPDIVDTVLNQIFTRLARARENRLIADSTFQYFFRKRNNRLWPGDAFQVLGTDQTNAAIEGFKAGISENGKTRLPPVATAEELEEAEQARTPRPPTEFTRLLRSAVLPPGWTAVVSNPTKGASPTCYEDRFTSSATLTRPKISTVNMRQITVGFLQQNGSEGLSCHVDLLACNRAKTDPEDLDELAHNLEERFPYYDDAWLASEWNTEPNVVDVLGLQKEPWRIRTFASYLTVPEVGKWRYAVPLLTGVSFFTAVLLGITAILVYSLVFFFTGAVVSWLLNASLLASVVAVGSFLLGRASWHIAEITQRT